MGTFNPHGAIAELADGSTVELDDDFSELDAIVRAAHLSPACRERCDPPREGVSGSGRSPRVQFDLEVNPC